MSVVLNLLLIFYFLNVKQIRKRKTKKMLPQVKQVKDTNHCFLLGYKASSLLGQKGCTSAFPILCVNFMCMFC